MAERYQPKYRFWRFPMILIAGVLACVGLPLVGIGTLLLSPVGPLLDWMEVSRK